MLFISIGFLVFAYNFCLHARITVFNPDKTFWTMIGKPWSFTRRYKASDFEELVVSKDFSYAGQLGMIQYWQRHFFIFAVKHKKAVLLLRDNSWEEAETSLKELSRLTGISIAKKKVSQDGLAPDLRVELSSQSKNAKPEHMTTHVGSLAELQKKFPTAHVLKTPPPKFPSGKNRKVFAGDYFKDLLTTAKIPHYFDHATPIQEEIWFFQNPLIVPLKLLMAFKEFNAVHAQNPEGFILFTAVAFQFEEFRWESHKK